MIDKPLARIWTSAEAAEYLRMTPRALIKIAKKTGRCSVVGRDILLSDEDIVKIWESMRCPNPNSGSSLSADRAYNELLNRARELTAKRRPKRFAKEG